MLFCSVMLLLNLQQSARAFIKQHLISHLPQPRPRAHSRDGRNAAATRDN